LICEGDDVRLRLQTDGLKFSWTPAGSIDDPFVKNPFATPTGTTTYMVTASISTCTASDDVIITTVPYPVADAGADTSICFNTTAQLHATSDGSSYNWSPAGLLQNAGTLFPIAHPISSTTYILYAYDTKGCPKAGTDSVFVNVETEIIPSAGRDTTAVINQPLQMAASGGLNYEWIPSTGLSATNISNPVAKYSRSPDEGFYVYKVLVSDATGCMDSAYVRVKVFTTQPEIYVPSAFTPNSDGHNDFFQIIAAGIREIELFQVYNRWGQIVFDSPAAHSLGWDGTYGGKAQPAGTYVWVVKATDYTGQPMVRKGTITLIR
jgi:gliding motility-associated-like protein